jgi:hypothetical protein
MIEFCFLPACGQKKKKRDREIVVPWVHRHRSEAGSPVALVKNPKQSLGPSSPHLQGRVSHHE